MNTPLTLFAGMLGGWELLLIAVVMIFMLAVVGSIVFFAIWSRHRNRSLTPPEPPVAAPTPGAGTVRICKSCRAPLPAGAPEGLCPQCLLKAGLGSESGAGNEPGSSQEGSTPPAPAEIAVHFPQLEIVEVLGQGGMGIVYKARQPHLDRFVALKILSAEYSRDPAFAERFQREARALAKLNHPNIVSVFDFGQAGPYYFFIMEYVDGANLGELEHARRLSPAEALSIVPKVCDALQYAHDEGVVHRDIKPGNILVDKRGRVKIADFGLAKLLGKSSADVTLTQSNVVMGTPRYMAPEQMERPTEVDHRADIYSLGVVFYEMLTGEVPMGRFAPPSQKVQVDVRLDEVVLRSLERDVQLRYQQASEVKSDVEAITTLGVKAQNSISAPESAAASNKIGLKQQVLFWGSALVVLQLSWLLPATLWRFRDAGCVVAAVLMGSIFTALAYWRVQQKRALATYWNYLPRAERISSLAICVLFGAFGYFLLFSALLGFWESAEWNSLAQTAEQFAASHKGQEYKLIRYLTAFKDQVPAVELTRSSWQYVGGWHIWGECGPYSGLFRPTLFWVTLVIAFILLVGILPSLLSSYTKRGKPQTLAFPYGCFIESLPLTLLALLTSLMAFGGLRELHLRTVVGDHKGLFMTQPHFALTAEQTRQALNTWAEQEGYVMGNNSSWTINAVPKGNVLGEVSLMQAWKPSPYDRWSLTPNRLTRISPHVAVTAVSSTKPVETEITFYPSLSPTDPQLFQLWKASLERLENTLKRAENNSVNPASMPVNAVATSMTNVPTKTEQAIIYTWGGDTGFIKGPDGPIYSRKKIAEFGFNQLQTEEVNKITPRYYRDFLSLERQHTTITNDAKGHVHVRIEPFRDESIALAQRMVNEIRGTTGKSIVPGDFDLRGVGIVGFLRLFRHDGGREVKAELWKDKDGYHFSEAFGEERDASGGTRSGGSRMLHGKTWKEAFPEEYWIYWNEK